MITMSPTYLCQRASQDRSQPVNAPNKTHCFIKKEKTAAAALWPVDNLAASAFVDLCS